MRCIVSVATSDFYIKLQERLLNSMLGSVHNISRHYSDRTASWDTGKRTGIDLMLWTDILPPGSKPHTESPYGFKVHAIKYAYSKGYTSVLWLDSPAYAVKKDLSAIFEKIEKEGYYAMSHVDPLKLAVGNKALNYFKMKRKDLSGLNLPSGSCVGFKVEDSCLFWQWSNYEWLFANDNSMFRDKQIVHRHDEAVLALILKQNELPVMLNDPLFQSSSFECLIRSGE